MDQWWWEAYMAQEDKKDAALKKLLEEQLPFYLDKIDKRLEANQKKKSKFIATKKMTIADFDLAAVAYSYILNEDNFIFKDMKKVLTKYPRVEEYYEMMKEELKDFFADRPRYPF